MRVVVKVAVEVDPDAYRAEYAESYDIAEIRDAVKSDVVESVRAGLFPFTDVEAGGWARSIEEAGR